MVSRRRDLKQCTSYSIRVRTLKVQEQPRACPPKSNDLVRWKRRKFINTPSRLLLMLVKGSLESLSSRTTFVLLSKAGSIRVNFIMCPGNHDGGPGRAGR